jgi:hypothetical protein
MSRRRRRSPRTANRLFVARGADPLKLRLERVWLVASLALLVPLRTIQELGWDVDLVTDGAIAAALPSRSGPFMGAMA